MMKRIHYMFYFLRRIFIFYVFDYNPSWDKTLNEIIDDHKILKISEGYIVLEHKGDKFYIDTSMPLVTSYYLLMKNDKEIPEEYKFRPSIRTQYRFEKTFFNIEKKKI